MNAPTLTYHLRDSFRGIGAAVRSAPRPAARRNFFGDLLAEAPRIRVAAAGFELLLRPETRALVLDSRRADRHLVLSLQDPGAAPERFLCGFDERHWFAAAVTGHTVPAAKDSLMPAAVREAMRRAGLRHADRHRRQNRAFVRQGEWFFVPDEQVVMNPLYVKRREPLVRPGGGKPHLVDELAQGGGELVWHHADLAPGGLTDQELAGRSEWARKAGGWTRRMRIGPGGTVHARGAVRHPDHATIWLGTWHRVFINTEVRPASLGFLD